MGETVRSKMRIESKGQALGTKVFVGDTELIGVQSINIQTLDADSGEVVAIIKVSGVMLGEE